MKSALLALVMTAAWMSAAVAGIPLVITVKCPVGGEEFDITGTGSCTTFPERTLSMQPITSCDFVTRLPQCPTNRLPMYREFSPDEVTQLKTLMASPAYEKAMQKSRYYLAREIELELAGRTDENLPLWLLIEGFWYDAQNTLADEAYVTEFLAELSSAMPTLRDDEKTVIYGVATFVAYHIGDLPLAQALLEKIPGTVYADEPVAIAWREAMEVCLNSDGMAGCLPETVVDAR